MTLEEALLAAANRGLTHLSLHPVFSEDRKTTYWRATATPSTMHKYVSTQALNPVEAVLEVLKALPKAPARTVTAAVKPRFDTFNPPLSELPQRAVDLDQQAEEQGVGVTHHEATNPPEAGGLDAWLPKA